LVGYPEGKRILGRHRSSWEDNIKMDLSETGYEYVNWNMSVLVFWVVA
jgi:hypothetical protein